MIKSGLLTCLLGIALPVWAGDIECDQAVLRGVNKITGRTTTAELNIGEPSTFDTLQITVRRCLKKPPEEMPENAAFLTIEEKNRDNALQMVFNGWMFSSNPALSAMEHPIYDIWVVECQATEPPPKDWEQIIPVESPNITHPNVRVERLNDI